MASERRPGDRFCLCSDRVARRAGPVNELAGQAGSGFYLCSDRQAISPISGPVVGPAGWLASERRAGGPLLLTFRSGGQRTGQKDGGQGMAGGLAGARTTASGPVSEPVASAHDKQAGWPEGWLALGRTTRKPLTHMFAPGRPADRSADQ